MDNKGQLQTLFYDRTDNFSFAIVKFPFLFSNIQVAIFVLSKYVQYKYKLFHNLHFLSDRGLLLARKLIKQEFEVVKVLSSHRNFTIGTTSCLTFMEYLFHRYIKNIVTTTPSTFLECDHPNLILSSGFT